MKNHFLSLLLLTAAFSLAAEEDISLLKAKIDLLEGKRLLSLKEMAKLRQDLIRKDPSLRKIHERIISEHRKLALLLDSKKEIHDMNAKLLAMDAEIQTLMDRMAKAEKENAEKNKNGTAVKAENKAEPAKNTVPAPISTEKTEQKKEK